MTLSQIDHPHASTYLPEERLNRMVNAARRILADAAHHQTPALTVAACVIAEYTHGTEQAEANTLLQSLPGYGA